MSVKRSLVAVAIGGVALMTSVVPASAQADERATCAAVIASNLAPGGNLPVEEYKAIAAREGLNFGQFVVVAAQLHGLPLSVCTPQ